MIDKQWLDKLATAAQDTMLDDFPSVRIEGAMIMQRMLTPVAVLQLIELVRKNTTT